MKKTAFCITILFWGLCNGMDQRPLSPRITTSTLKQLLSQKKQQPPAESIPLLAAKLIAYGSALGAITIFIYCVNGIHYCWNAGCSGTKKVFEKLDNYCIKEKGTFNHPNKSVGSQLH